MLTFSTIFNNFAFIATKHSTLLIRGYINNYTNGLSGMFLAAAMQLHHAHNLLKRNFIRKTFRGDSRFGSSQCAAR